MIPPVLVKIISTVLTGGVAYFITNLTGQDQVWTLTLSVFIGGVVLVIQFLVDFEKRLDTVESALDRHAAAIGEQVGAGFRKINQATELFGLLETSAVHTDSITQLVRNATEIRSSVSPLVTGFVQGEIGRMSQFLKELSDGDVTYDGEDRDWLLGLTRSVRHTIDATSMSTVDGGGHGYSDGFWAELGQSYLEVQRDAIARGVKIRRVFILEDDEQAHDPDFLHICRTQAEMNIDVRVLLPSKIPVISKGRLFDFILFDDTISYDVTPAAQVGAHTRPAILSTRLVLRPNRVTERKDRFRELWNWAGADG